MKIKNQLLLKHGLLVILAFSIIFINVFVYKNIESDAQIINQTGKLRMLSYNIAQLTNQLKNQTDNREGLLRKLELRIYDFEVILESLTYESHPINLHPQSVVKLEKINKEWNESFNPLYIKILNDNSTESGLASINNSTDIFVNGINEMVTTYSVYSRDKIKKALEINGFLVFVSIIIMLYSFSSTNQHIRKPMRILIQELKELSPIDDEVSKRSKNIKKDEISEMTEYFNEMIYDQLTVSVNPSTHSYRLKVTL